MQAFLKENWNYSAQHMADLMGIDRGHMKHVESGKRQITPEFTLAFRKLERDVAYLVREAEERDRPMIEWLITALERSTGLLDTADRARLRRLLKGDAHDQTAASNRRGSKVSHKRR